MLYLITLNYRDLPYLTKLEAKNDENSKEEVILLLKEKYVNLSTKSARSLNRATDSDYSCHLNESVRFTKLNLPYECT